MKYIFALSLVLTLFLFGCDQGNDLNSPSDYSTDQNVKLISIPAPVGGMSVETIFTDSRLIEGKGGGNFEAKFEYEGGPFGEVTVRSKLSFDDYAFEGEKLIIQTLDTDYAVISYGPSMQFAARVKLNLKFEGLDLSGIDENTVDFVFIDSNGNIENVEYHCIDIHFSDGKIEVHDAELTHFSRYGFVNRTF